MLTTLSERRRFCRQFGIGMPGDSNHILKIARQLCKQIDAPVLGGIAVNLHGAVRTTTDLDFYTPDRSHTHVQLTTAGAHWDAKRREFVLEGVRIHTVTPEDAKHTVQKTSMIDGVRVVSLKDLLAIKLICGLNNTGRAKDIGDVESLIRVVPLDKRFADKLPKELRTPFKKIVDGVRYHERATKDGPRF